MRERARKIVEGLADDDDELHHRLAALEDTYSKALMNSKDTKGCSKFLKLNLAARQSPSNPKRSTNVFHENRCHDIAAASYLADSRTHSDGHQFPQPPR